jgi:hypothetical protein
VSDRVDYFAKAFGGFDPSGDPDAALKFVLNAILMDNRLDELSSIVTDGHEIGALEGEPGWTLERRDGRNVRDSVPMSIPTNSISGMPKRSRAAAPSTNT